MNPLISIRVPIRNTESRSRAGVDSILDQNRCPAKNMQIADGSAAISGEYSLQFPEMINFMDNPIRDGGTARSRGLNTTAKGA